MGKRDPFWEHAIQYGNRFFCKFCKCKFPGGSFAIRSHLAGILSGNVPPCTIVPQDVQAKASKAIARQKKKTKSPSPMVLTPLPDIQKIDTSETSTKKGQDCLDDSPIKHVPESSNRVEIRKEGFTEPDKSFGLRFMTSMPSHLFTDTKVQGDQGTAIQVALLNLETEHVVQSGPGSAAKLNLVVLGGESEELDPKWDQLESHIMGKPILSADLVVTLEGGKATLCDFTFMQDSSKTRSGKYRLGVKVACQCYAAMHIKGAVSEAFIVEDSRGEFVKKYLPLLPSDYVWRLVGVPIKGEAHRQLREVGIRTVQDFVHLLYLDEAKLRNIVAGGISDAMWKHTLEHAKSQVDVDKKYAYYFDERKQKGIIFNWCFEPIGLILKGCERWVESGGEKIYLESQCKIAYKNQDQFSEYHFQFPDFEL